MAGPLDFWRGRSPTMNQRSIVNRLFGDFLDDDLDSDLLPTIFGLTSTALPRLDYEETDDSYLFRVDMPGIPKENINIQFSGNTVTVRGEREMRTRNGEREYRKFLRSFVIPQPVDENRIEASYDNGVLTIAIPKGEESKARSIPVKEGQSFGKLASGGNAGGVQTQTKENQTDEPDRGRTRPAQSKKDQQSKEGQQSSKMH
jgi:HSP20 family protein